MAKVSEIKAKVLAAGHDWTPELYDYAVSRGAEADEQAPGVSPQVQSPAPGGRTFLGMKRSDFNMGPPGTAIGPTGLPMFSPAAAEFGDAAVRGLTGGLINPERQNLPAPRSKLEEVLGKVANVGGETVGMMTALPLIPVPGFMRVAAKPGAALASRFVQRVASAAPRLTAYEAIRGGAEGYQGGEGDRTLEDLLRGLVSGGFKGLGLSALFAGLPSLPAKLGGEMLPVGGLMGGMTLARGGSLEDALISAGVGAGAHKLTGFNPRANKGQTLEEIRRLEEESAWDTKAQEDAFAAELPAKRLAQQEQQMWRQRQAEKAEAEAAARLQEIEAAKKWEMAENLAEKQKTSTIPTTDAMTRAAMRLGVETLPLGADPARALDMLPPQTVPPARPGARPGPKALEPARIPIKPLMPELPGLTPRQTGVSPADFDASRLRRTYRPPKATAMKPPADLIYSPESELLGEALASIPQIMSSPSPAQVSIPGPKALEPARIPIKPLMPELPVAPKGKPESGAKDALRRAGWSEATDFVDRADVGTSRAKTPPSEMYLGGGLGPLQELGSQLKRDLVWNPEAKRMAAAGQRKTGILAPPPVEAYGPHENIPLSRGLYQHRETGDIRAFAREIPAMKQVPEEVVADLKRVKEEYGDLKSGASLLSDPLEAVAGFAGRPGSPADRALVGDMANIEHSRIRQATQWQMATDALAEKLGVKEGNKIDRSFGVIAEQIGMADVDAPNSVLAQRPAIQKAATELGLSLPELDAALTWAKHGRQMLDAVRDQTNEARRAGGRKEIPYINQYVTWMRRNRLFHDLKQPALYEQGKDVPDFVHPLEKLNPRAERRGLTAEYEREMSGMKLLRSYYDISSKDIFYNAALQHYRALSKVMRDLEMPNMAAKLDNISDVQFGVKPPIIEKMKNRAGFNTGARYALRRSFEWMNRNWFGNIFGGSVLFPIQTQAMGLANVPGMVGTQHASTAARLIADPKWCEAFRYNAPIGALKRVQEGRLTASEGLQKNKWARGKAQKLAYGFMDGMEDFTTMYGAAAYYSQGYKHGLRGRALWDYADAGGKRVAGFYASYLKPEMISGRTASMIAPMQSYNFQMFNNLRAMSGPGARTGHFEVQGEGNRMRRAYAFGRFVAFVVSANLLADELGLRPAWKIPGSAIPGGELLTGGATEDPQTVRRISKKIGVPQLPSALGASTYGMEAGRPWFGQVVSDANKALAGVLREDKAGDAAPDWRPARRFALMYLNKWGGGAQIDRIIRAAEAFANEGRVQNIEGDTEFVIPQTVSETARAFAWGPQMTKAAKEKRDKEAGKDSGKETAGTRRPGSVPRKASQPRKAVPRKAAPRRTP